MKIEIKSRYTESVLFSHDVDENTLKISLLAALKAGADLCGANLCGANLYGANLRVADLSGADLRCSDLRESNLRESNLLGSDLRGADLLGADLCGANLYGANLDGANLYGANLDGEKILQNPIKMIGHQYWILITDSFMRIGCQRHTHQQWAEFDSKQIDDMDSHATEFWNQWEAPLLAMCKAHSDKVKK